MSFHLFLSNDCCSAVNNAQGINQCWLQMKNKISPISLEASV